jgi:heterodisulfide reductase subunit C
MDVKEKIALETAKLNLSHCFSCGVCTGGCPVARLEPAFNPRRFLHEMKLGIESGDEIWYCVNCLTCQERCPTKVAVADFLNLLRQESILSKGAPAFVKAQVESLKKCGFAADLGNERDNKKREAQGLTPLQTTDEIATIIAATGGDIQ